jgi:hypothetical protein
VGEEGEASLYFTIKLENSNVTQTAVSYSVGDYNESYPDAKIKVLADNNAGFIQAQFHTLTQNEIAGITYSDIKVSFPASEEYEYIFTNSAELFNNSVPYVESI